MITNDDIRGTRAEVGKGMRSLLCAAFLISHFSFLISSAGAQGMVTEIKVVAVQEFADLAAQASGYSGDGDAYLDFRKGRGGGCVFAIFKNSTDTAQYITDVAVEIRDNYGEEFTSGGKKFTPVPFYQEEKKHKDGTYRGGLNGRNYSIFGGAYEKQAHVYVSRTGNNDFSKKVLRSAKVTTSKPKDLTANQTYSGGHAGGGRYFVFTWHNHESKYEATGDITVHKHYCDRDQCGLTKIEPHHFPQLYDGIDTWMQFPKTDKLSAEKHYKKCLDCGQIVSESHKWASYSSDWGSHNQRCLVCDFVIKANHVNFGKQKIPVDDFYHMIYCDCGFFQKLRHEYGDVRTEKNRNCETVVMEYTCKQCYHRAYFEEPGEGHDYDQYGICRRKSCLHPYEKPAVEPLAGTSDSVYVVKSFGNLYWIADYVNNRRPKTNVRLANDLIADDFMRQSWLPIGATDSTAFQGTFDGGGHVITTLQTEEPVAGCGYRGLFGTIGKDATVQDVTLVACNMRGWNNVGAVAGVNQGTIKGCHVLFSIMSSIGNAMNLGGICGLNKGTITGCVTESNVWVGGVRDYAGGICGTNDGGSLSGNTSAAICGSGSDAILPETASQQ